MGSYNEDFAVFGDQVADVVGQGELARPDRVGDQVVVVDEVVAAEGDEDECTVYEPRRLVFADEKAQPLLVLHKVVQLLCDPDYVGLMIKIRFANLLACIDKRHIMDEKE